MSVEAVIYAALSGHAPLTALVAARIYPVTLPEDCIYPAVVYQLADRQYLRTLCGDAGASLNSVAVDSYAPTYSEARAVADAVRAALAAVPGCSVGSESDQHEPDMDLHQVAALFSLFHEE